jgi:hypothetical protein
MSRIAPCEHLEEQDGLTTCNLGEGEILGTPEIIGRVCRQQGLYCKKLNDVRDDSHVALVQISTPSR